MTDDGGHPTRLYTSCLKDEQQAYDALRRSWGSLSGFVREDCLREWGRGDGGYVMLHFCAVNEAAAERRHGATTFHW